MKGKIAIEQNLTPVKTYLSSKGYNVESISMNDQNTKKLQGYDAIIVTGQNSDFLGFETTKTNAVVINADGLTPEEVAKELEEKH